MKSTRFGVLIAIISIALCQGVNAQQSTTNQAQVTTPIQPSAPVNRFVIVQTSFPFNYASVSETGQANTAMRDVPETLKVDTTTGKTWILCPTDNSSKNLGQFVWVEIADVDLALAQEPAALERPESPFHQAATSNEAQPKSN